MEKVTIKQAGKIIQTTGAVSAILGFAVLFVAYCVEETTRAGWWIAVLLVVFGVLMALFGTCLKDAEFDDRGY